MQHAPSDRRPAVWLTLSALVVTAIASPLYAQPRSVGVDPANGTAAAAVVDDEALVHTTQLLPFDKTGGIAADDLDGQMTQVLANLRDALIAAGTQTDQLVRLNVYAARNELVAPIRELLARKLTRRVHPAVTTVVTPLAQPEALLALDAVAAVPRKSPALTSVIRTSPPGLSRRIGSAQAAVLPRGRVVYISGMASREKDLAGAATGTMQQLHGVLRLLDLKPEHVVHLKAFMKPMTQVARARKAMRAFYPDAPAPPMTFVEWTNGLPIEIEMIAFIPGKPDSAQTVQHRWQPDERRSPVYCRFAVVDSATRIYVAGLRARPKTDAPGQVRDIFAQLKATLAQTDSDFRHMVKATYYVADDDVSKSLNNIRPELYDPQHPPAASKASIAGTGDDDRTITIDMIAVPKGK